jgi:hypothetical protein
MEPQTALNPTSSPELADDLLRGADEIATFIFGARGSRRKVYYLAECSRLPVFRLGSVLCARKSILLEWISDAAAVGSSSLSLIAGSVQPVKFVDFSAPAGGSYESWKALIAYDALKKLFAVPSLELRKSTTLPDGKTDQTVIAIDTLGLEAAWQVLSASGCPRAG